MSLEEPHLEPSNQREFAVYGLVTRAWVPYPPVRTLPIPNREYPIELCDTSHTLTRIPEKLGRPTQHTLVGKFCGGSPTIP